jgi:hypothetical protein
VLSRKSTHAYFLLWKHLDNQQVVDNVKTKLAESEEAKKNKILKLLAVLGKSKPYVYFLLWKD